MNINTDPNPANIWTFYNLQGSPFFQDSLQTGEGARYPIELFVGRARQLQRHLNVIGSAGPQGSSRQVISGVPGVGKSSLAQAVKARAAEHGYLSSPEAVALGHADSTDVLAIRILDYLYQAVVGNGGSKVESAEAIEDVRQLIRAFRVNQLSAGLSVSLPLGGGAGVSGGHAKTFVNPSTVYPAVVIGELMRNVMNVARNKLGAKGILVHMNNLENITEEQALVTARVLRDLRDPCLMAGSYHWLLAGTTDAIRMVVAGTEQVRTVFNFGTELEPLASDEVIHMLTRRYRALRLHAKQAVRPPVTNDAVTQLYAIFRGDLRGTLVALDDAAHELLGYAGNRPRAPLTFEDLRSVLPGIYAERVRSLLGAEGGKALQMIAAFLRKSKKEDFTQQDVSELSEISQPTASRLITELLSKRFVIETGKERAPGARRPTTHYALTGAARLAFGKF